MTFEEILTDHNIPIAPNHHHHSRLGWIQIDCPWCGKGSGKYHLGYNISGGYCNCWKCGPKYIIQVLVLLTGQSFTKCKKLIDSVEKGDFQEPLDLQERGKYLPPPFEPLRKAHTDYLKKRKYEWQELNKLWEISGLSVAGNLSWRIFIPIIYKGEKVSWTTRSVSTDKKTVRYISASPKQEILSHKSLLYGEDYARHSIIITEGPFDVWRIGPGAVATFGTNFTQAQVNKMIKYPVRAICFDSDLVAQTEAKRLYDLLASFPGETYNIILDAKDAGEATDKEIAKIREKFL